LCWRYQFRDERKVVEGQHQTLTGTIKTDREAQRGREYSR
jgi:hypothetical protein